jgi:hypothetical protein
MSYDEFVRTVTEQLGSDITPMRTDIVVFTRDWYRMFTDPIPHFSSLDSSTLAKIMGPNARYAHVT